MKTPPSVEFLENRIAPATLTGNVLTYTDADGDAVTINFSTAAALTPALFTFDTAFEASGPQQLQLIDLTTSPAADGASIVMKVTQAGGGNGRADVGFINAGGIDLGKVSLAGDLGRIVAGNGDATPALKSLSVYSMGVADLSTQGGSGSLASTITGPVGSIKVATDIVNASIEMPLIAGRGAKLGSLAIGNDLRGGEAAGSGAVKVSGSIKKISVGGGLEGGVGASSGKITSGGAIGSIVIGVPDGPVGAIAIAGGEGSNSGGILAQTSIKKVVVHGDVLGNGNVSGAIISTAGGISNITIDGSLRGGTGDQSGFVSADLVIGKISVKGNLIGGGGSSSGLIEAAGGMGAVSIGDSIQGGDKVNSGAINSQRGITSVRVENDVIGGAGAFSGAVRPDGFLLSLIIGGNVTGGAGNQSGLVHAGLIQNVSIAGNLQSGLGLRSGMVESDNSIASLKIAGNVIGSSAVPATIVARGAVKPTKTADVAMGSIQIGGNAEFLNVLAGFDETVPVITQQIHPGVNGNAQIRSVKIGGTAAGLNIVAGVLPGADGKFATDDDAPYGNLTDAIDPLIAKLTVVGQWLATGLTDDAFVVTADRVLKASVNGSSVALSSADDAEVVTLSADTRLIEFV